METQVKEYADLTEAEQAELSKAWQKIADGLATYEAVTNANNLDEILYEDLWEAVYYQKEQNNG